MDDHQGQNTRIGRRRVASQADSVPATAGDLFPLTLKLEECAFVVLHLHCRLPSAICHLPSAIFTMTMTITTMTIIIVFSYKETGFCAMWESQ
jgi:hypothetical protein